MREHVIWQSTCLEFLLRPLSNSTPTLFEKKEAAIVTYMTLQKMNNCNWLKKWSSLEESLRLSLQRKLDNISKKFQLFWCARLENAQGRSNSVVQMSAEAGDIVRRRVR